MPKTTAAFLLFLKDHAARTEQLFLLGDIFEYWAGDDDLDSAYPRQIVDALSAVSELGVKTFWMAGNRDFLVGNDFACAARATRLDDPHTFDFANQRYMLSHGDQFCTDDQAYQIFRAQVRQAAWQARFLAQPLNERKNMIADMRQKSRLHQQQSPMIMDVNRDAVSESVGAHRADILIHGHTHRPARHAGALFSRYVLSDWDFDHKPVRGDWLALMTNGELKRHHAPDELVIE